MISSGGKKFDYAIENFRGVAILFVVFSHVDSLLLAGGLHLRFLLVDASAFFVFIAGFLFFKLEVLSFNFYSYLKRKAQNVLSPYLFFSMVAFLIGAWFGKNEIYGLTLSKYFVWSFVVGGVNCWPFVVYADDIFVLYSCAVL